MVSRVLRVHAGVQCDPADRRAVPTVLGQWDERRPVRLLRRHRHGHGEPQAGGAHQSRGAGAGDGAGQSERGRRHRVRRFATYRGRAAQPVSGERHFLKKEARMHATIKSEKGMALLDRKSTRLNSSHSQISYAVFCLKKKNKTIITYNDSISQISTKSESSLTIGRTFSVHNVNTLPSISCTTHCILIYSVTIQLTTPR